MEKNGGGGGGGERKSLRILRRLGEIECSVIIQENFSVTSSLVRKVDPRAAVKFGIKFLQLLKCSQIPKQFYLTTSTSSPQGWGKFPWICLFCTCSMMCSHMCNTALHPVVRVSATTLSLAATLSLIPP